MEDGTRLARQVRTGVVPAPDEDDLADKYVLADDALAAAGLEWYEVSNWARDDGRAAAGTTSSTGPARTGGGSGRARTPTSTGERWWNVKHPSAYAARIAAGESPAQDGEVLDEATRHLERVLLEVRLRDGLPLDAGRAERVDGVVARGLGVRRGDRLVLTRQGRLLADAVVRDLVD